MGHYPGVYPPRDLGVVVIRAENAYPYPLPSLLDFSSGNGLRACVRVRARDQPVFIPDNASFREGWIALETVLRTDPPRTDLDA